MTLASRPFGLPLTVLAVTALAACNTFDDPVAVSVRNDRTATVTLLSCKSKDCAKTGDRWTLTPGQAVSANVEPRSGYNSFVLLGVDGSQVGCMPFRFKDRPRITVQVSDAVPCGGNGGASAAQGRDWPNPKL